ncbi:MAG: hypothetical protein ABR501_10730 [Pyrinomonadaceae bacterium]
MKVLVRLISFYYAVVTFLTLIIVVDLVISPRTQGLGSTGVFEMLALIGWALNLLVGPYATVQLWRLKPRGRWGAIVLSGYGIFYYAVAFILKQPEFQAAYLVFDLVLVSVLLSIPLKRYASERFKDK